MTRLARPVNRNGSGDGPEHAQAKGDQTVMERIHRIVAENIERGILLSGQRLPSVRAMAARHGVSRDSVLRAYDKLVAGGQIYAVRGSGFYVARAAPIPPSPAGRPERMRPLDPLRLIHSDFPLDRTPGSGVLRHAEGAQDEVSRVLRTAVAALGTDGTHGDPLGYLPLRRQLSDKLAGEGIDAPVDNIVTTPGCVAALTLVTRALLRPGRWILVEDPCPFIHSWILSTQGATVAHVPRLSDGPDLEMLRTLCERHRPAIFLLSSVLQNPTGTSMAPYKAQKLIEIAAEFDMVLIDDASYLDLLPSTGPATAAMPLLLLDRMRHVIHVGGFSHTIAPAIAPGFVVVGERWAWLVRNFRPTQGLGNMIVQERVLFRFLHEGLYRRRCERIRAHLSRCASTFGRMAAAAGLPLPSPNGGLFCWASLGDGVDSAAVATRMLAKGYLTAPFGHFTYNEDYRSHMRLNATTTNLAALEALAESL